MKKSIAILSVTFSLLFTSNSFAQTDAETPKTEATIVSGMIIGEFSCNSLKEGNFAKWYVPGYENYEVETSKLKGVKGKINDFEIETFVGTWCGDSKRELPHLYKILEAVNYPIEKKMKIYGVNHQKKTINGEEVGKDITHVPTIIFYKKGKEVGRIVESPVSGYLEEDIAMIVKGTPLKPNYSKN